MPAGTAARLVVVNALAVGVCVVLGWGTAGVMAAGLRAEELPVADGMVALVALVAAVALLVLRAAVAILGIFVAVGAGMVWAGLTVPDGDGAVVMVAVGAAFVGLLVVVAVVLGMVRLVRLPGQRRAAWLVDHGIPALGTVVDVRDTGATINQHPRLDVTFRIEPEDGSPGFDGTKTTAWPRVALPVVGQRYPVWIDPVEQGSFVVATRAEPGAPPAALRLFELARAASGEPVPPAPGTVAPAVPPPVTGQAGDDPLDQLARLHELHRAGALTAAEFEQQKARLLDGA